MEHEHLMDTGHPEPEMPPQKGSYGALISIVVILAAFVIGALYVWSERTTQEHIGVPETATSAQQTP